MAEKVRLSDIEARFIYVRGCGATLATPVAIRSDAASGFV